MEENIDRFGRLIAYQKGGNRRAYVNDEDLQIQISTQEIPREINQEAFKKLHSHHKEKQESGRHSAVEEEMREAEATFQSMMEIRKTLTEHNLRWNGHRQFRICHQSREFGGFNKNNANNYSFAYR